uniref:Cytochrome b n=1 Tax=Onchocerca volvulus TaxID=6282 RepID=A0A8R1TJ79_ONCVO
MHDVNYGWLVRYTHAIEASLFFMVVYIHIMRGLYYGSYKKPREMVWFIGILIFCRLLVIQYIFIIVILIFTNMYLSYNKY